MWGVCVCVSLCVSVCPSHPSPPSFFLAKWPSARTVANRKTLACAKRPAKLRAVAIERRPTPALTDTIYIVIYLHSPPLNLLTHFCTGWDLMFHFSIWSRTSGCLFTHCLLAFSLVFSRCSIVLCLWRTCPFHVVLLFSSIALHLRFLPIF